MTQRAMLAGTSVFLVGPPMPDRSKDRDQTNSDPWSSRLGVGHWANNPVLEKIDVTETATKETKLTGCNGFSESSQDTQMNGSSESLRETTARMVKVLSTKTKTRIGFWNVRTMYDTGKLAQVISEMRCYNLHILGVSESRWTGSGRLRTSTGETVLYSGRDDNQHFEGVAIILKKGLEKSMIEWKPVNNRLIKIRLKGKQINTTIIQCYAPTNNNNEDEKDRFYEELQALLEETPRHDMKIVMGDMNAKIGSDNTNYERAMGREGCGTMNENGERLMELCTTYNLVVGGTLFPHREIHKLTWYSPNGRDKNQIDHFMINCTWRRSLLDVRAKRGADVGSDHHMVVATVKVKLRKTGVKRPGRQELDVEKLQNPKIKSTFVLQLRNKYQALAAMEDYTKPEQLDVNTRWEHLKAAYLQTSEGCLGTKERKRKEWIKENTLKAISTRRALKKQLLDVKSERHIPITDKNGRFLTSETEIDARWAEHFSEVLNRPPPTSKADIKEAEHDLDINTAPPEKEEIVATIMSLKNRKAPGHDKLNAELFKADPELAAKMLLPLFTAIWKERQIPTDWSEGIIVKIPKKRTLSNCNNWRGITLLSIPSKILAKIIIQRLSDAVDQHLRKEQAGFRKGRGCTDQIFVLRNIIEQCTEWQRQLYINFVDFEKAFDSIHRDSLWRILRAYGIPQDIVLLIQSFYNNFTCKVVNSDHCFHVKTGVRQGCVMSAFLFNIAIDWVMRRTTEKQTSGLRWTLSYTLEDLDFADDLALISHTHQHIQEKTYRINTYAEQIGLRINLQKTEVMTLNIPNPLPVQNLRRIMRIFWPNTISNEQLLACCNQDSIGTIIMRRRWRWIGHLLRREQESITRTALHWTPEGKRKRGRPKNTWRRTVEGELKNMNHTWGTIQKLAQNRQEWKTFVAALHASGITGE
ncbi:uncharacterized protein [Paramisgurnus dabryanus]|uniref:uncharacterized protein n=1 Tax=Paramisgurnus dabryanus TaxID=90735 RepID=UPI003CCFD578